ncbi:MAG: adenylyl-sulfate kinase [Spirochaetes bacterium GWF1_49_6]|nr:MAG: adenylyl-sulfate kinase [Spirochaetes bacterium GWF1_49_6]
MNYREQFNIVISGHVDHGKSTVIGRLLADTNSLPDGKLESIREYCKKNSKTFEYAFLLDALKEEQSQGITIDAARIHFKTAKRDYLILDAPGHIEFLRNMITGATRAEGTLIVIDINEGIKENSRRHGYLISMLGIRQVSVLINKMDLAGYSRDAYDKIVSEYQAFLKRIGIEPFSFIPVAALNGENIFRRSEKMPWYEGPTVVEQIDCFEPDRGKADKPFRFPVQDVYKFTGMNDDRRILAGMVAFGSIRQSEEVLFLPSNKKSRIRTIETFSDKPPECVSAGMSCGFTIDDPLYIKPGEMMLRVEEPSKPSASRRFKANLFWMGAFPMVKGKQYEIKIGTAYILINLTEILGIMDASDLESIGNKSEVDRYEVAECVLETNRPVAFDHTPLLDSTSRFVIIDNYQISGAGIILQSLEDENISLVKYLARRENRWDAGSVTKFERETRYGHRAKLVLLTGSANIEETGKFLERSLYDMKFFSFYIGMKSLSAGLDNDLDGSIENREESIRRLGEISRILTDAGLIAITCMREMDDYDAEKIRELNSPYELLTIKYGRSPFDKFPADLDLPEDTSPETAVEKILELMRKKDIVPEYFL